MRFLYVISFVVLCGVIEKVAGMEALISGRQIETKIYPGQKILSTKTPIENGQNVTWHKSFGKGVLFFAGEVQFERENKVRNLTLGWDRKLDVCVERKDLSVADLVGQIIRISWLPTEHCPVEKGSSRLRNPFGPTIGEISWVSSIRRYIVKVVVGYSESDLVFSTTYEVEVKRIENKR